MDDVTDHSGGVEETEQTNRTHIQTRSNEEQTDRCGRVDEADSQTDRCGRVDEADSQTDRCGRVDEADGQTDRCGRVDEADGQTDRCGRVDEADGQTDRCGRVDEADGQTDRCGRVDEADSQTDRCDRVDEADGRTDGARNTEETDLSTEEGEYDNPVDKGWSWIVLLGSFGVCMLVIGGLKSFGVLYVELSKTFQVSNQALSTVQSITGFFYLALGPICNALSTRFTHRLVMFTGGVLISTGLILSSRASSVAVLYVTYGLITGIGFSLSFSPCMVIVGRYFRKYRGIATGLALSGGGLGAMWVPYAIRYFLNQYGLQGAMTIYAGIMGNVCVCAMLLRPYNSYPRKSRRHVHVQKDGQHEEEEILMNAEVAVVVDKESETCLESTVDIQDTATEKHFDKERDDDGTEKLLVKNKLLIPLSKDRTGNSLYQSNSSLTVIAASISCRNIPASFEQLHKQISNCNVAGVDKSSNQKRNFLYEIEWRLFLDPVFTLFVVMILFSMVSYHSIFNIVPPFADEIGLSGEDGAFILMIFGLTDLIGRVVAGILMDVLPNHHHVIFSVCVAVCAIGVTLTPVFRSLLTLCLFMASYGCFAGGYNGTAAIIAFDKVGLRHMSSAWGFLCFAASIAMLLNPMASGVIKDMTGTWAHAFRFTGSVSFVAVILLLIMPWVERRQKRKQEHAGW